MATESFQAWYNWLLASHTFPITVTTGDILPGAHPAQLAKMEPVLIKDDPYTSEVLSFRLCTVGDDMQKKIAAYACQAAPEGRVHEA